MAASWPPGTPSRSATSSWPPISAARPTPGAASWAAEAAKTAAPTAGRLGVVEAPWWERYPGRLEFELQELSDLGVEFSVDEAARNDGRLSLQLSWDVPGSGHVDMLATFPDLYPYFKPEVQAPALVLSHHQNPFAKNLCLVGRSTDNWNVHGTLASLLSEQLAKTLRAGSADPSAGLRAGDLDEEPQAEPFSDYYPYMPAAMFLIDGGWNIPPEDRSGQFSLEVAGPMPPDPACGVQTVGAVSEVLDTDGNFLATAQPRLVSMVRGLTLRGRWTRLDEPVRSDCGRALWDAAAQADGWETSRSNVAGCTIQLRALLFPEEVAWRQAGQGWLFVVRVSRPAARGRKKSTGKQKRAVSLPQKPPDEYLIIRAGRAGRADLAARVPSLAGLGDAAALVVGVGALGSAIAEQLARAGIGVLRVMDGDHLDPGNTVRHSLFLDQSGAPKAGAVAGNAIRRNPHVDAACSNLRLGLVRDRPGTPSDAAELDQLLDGIDLLVDATAEEGVQHFLSDEALKRGIAYLCVTATRGAWGGRIALIEPGVTQGCWMCLMHHRMDDSIPEPPVDPSGPVQPAGCADPTFTGPGFDLDEVSLQAVRVAVSTLLRKADSGYRTAVDDVMLLKLREPDGTPVLPTWTGYALARHQACENH